MCGICGLVGQSGKREQIIHQMMEAILHRGPDGEGTFFDERAALGFRRLAIVDLDHGDQPMFNETGDLVLVFNGEIYNFKELRQELMQKGHTFANQSDSEVLLHAYEEFGTDMLSRLRGMFGFAIWDRKKSRLFMARDPFGIKPVYYCPAADGSLAFASEIKSLLKVPSYKKEVNEAALDVYLTFQYSALEETFFKGIYKLLPGHFLIWEDGKYRTQAYEILGLTPDPAIPSEEKRRRLKEALTDSVAMHLRSDVEVGTFLSSGVDSSYLAAVSDVQKSFSVGFDGDHYNELKDLADDPNVKKDHHEKKITPEEYWEAIPRAMYHMDEPLADASCIALYFVDQLASEYVKVVFSGEGSDELFGGYPIYHEPLSLRPVDALPGGIKKQLRRWAEKGDGRRGKNFIRRGATPLEERFCGNANIFTAEEKHALLRSGRGTPSSEITKEVYDRNRSLGPVERMQEIDLNFWLPGDILLKADKMSMAHSLESRVPFLDREVYKAARILTTDEKVKGDQTKILFRGIAQEVLPPSTALKPKLGFPVPIRVWLRQPEYYTRLQEAFAGEGAKRFFNTELLEKLLQAHISGVKDNSRKLWTIYAFLVWYQIYFESADPDAYAVPPKPLAMLQARNRKTNLSPQNIRR